MCGVLRSRALGAGLLVAVVACGALKTGGRGTSAGGSGGGPSCALAPGDGGLDCNPGTGLGAPLPTCSAASPCTNVLPTYAGPVTTPAELPRCKTANADAFIDGLVASGKVDPRRIFVSGWSNGARFAQAYAIGRHETPTPSVASARVRPPRVSSRPTRGARCPSSS